MFIVKELRENFLKCLYCNYYICIGFYDYFDLFFDGNFEEFFDDLWLKDFLEFIDL